MQLHPFSPLKPVSRVLIPALLLVAGAMASRPGTAEAQPPPPTPITCGQTISGTLGPGDFDFFSDATYSDFYRFVVPSVGTVNFTITQTGPSGFAPFLLILDSDGAGVVSATGPISVALTAGVYRVIVNNFLPFAGTEGYQLTMGCNTTPATCGSSVTGRLEAGDFDYYRDGTYSDFLPLIVPATGPVRVNITQLGPQGFLPYYAIFDATGTELVSSATGFFQTSLAAGVYQVLVNNFLPLTGAFEDYEVRILCGAPPPDAPIACGQTVSGALSQADFDYFGDGTVVDAYSMSLSAPTTVSFGVEQTGPAFFTPFILVLNAVTGLEVYSDFPPAQSPLPLPAGDYLVVLNNITPLPPGQSAGYNLTLRCQIPPTVNCGDVVSGTLDDTDPDFFNDGTLVEPYQLTTTQPAYLTLDMFPTGPAGFVPYVYVIDTSLTTIFLQGVPPLTTPSPLPPGDYIILANNLFPFPPGEFENFDLTIDCTPLDAANCGDVIRGTLDNSDFDHFGDGTRADYYLFSTAAAVQLSVDMIPVGPPGFEPFILVTDAAFTQSFIGGTPPLTTAVPLPPGDYIIIANNFLPIPGGVPADYDLLIDCIQPPALACGTTTSGILDATDPDLTSEGIPDDLFVLNLPGSGLVDFSVQPTGAPFNPRIVVARLSDAIIILDSPAPLSTFMPQGDYLVVVTSQLPFTAGSLSYDVTVQCDLDSVGVIDCGDTVTGQLDDASVDFFRDGTLSEFFTLTLTAQTRVALSLTPTGTFFEPWIAVINSSLNIIFQGPSPQFGVLPAGTYTIVANNLIPVPAGQVYPFELNLFCGEPNPQVRSEYFEHPLDITRDDNDASNPTHNANDPARREATIATNFPRVDRSADKIWSDNLGQAGEIIVRGLSGLPWGGYSAAVQGGFNHDIIIYNRENVLGPGFLQNSFLSFGQHSSVARGDFPPIYNEETGSYVYTTFSDPASPVDMGGGFFRTALASDQNIVTIPRDQVFRFLIQTADGRWFRSNDQTSPNVNIMDRPFGWSGSNALTKEEREDLMSIHFLSDMTWERVSAAAEANMNLLDDGGAVPLGPTQPDGPPDLTQVIGMGLLLNQLSEGWNVGAIPNNVAVLGLILDNGQVSNNNACLDATEIPNNGPDAPVIFAPPLINSLTLTAGQPELNDPVLDCANPLGAPPTGSLWWVFEVPPATPGVINVDTFGSSYDTIIAVYDVSSQVAFGLDICDPAFLTQNARNRCNDNAAGTLQSRILAFPVSGGETILVFAAAAGGASPGDLDFNFAFIPGSVIPVDCNQTYMGQLDRVNDPDILQDGTVADLYRLTLNQVTSIDISVTPVGTSFQPLVTFLTATGGILFSLTTPFAEPLDFSPGIYLIAVSNQNALPKDLNDYDMTITCTLPPSIECGETINGQLEPTDEDIFEDGTFTDRYRLSLDFPSAVEVGMTAAGFQPFVQIRSVGGGPIVGGLPPITANLNRGDYFILANNLEVIPDGTYPYTLTVACEQSSSINCGEDVLGALSPLDPDYFGDGTFTDTFEFELDQLTDVTFNLAPVGGNVFVPYVLVGRMEGDGSVTELFQGPPPQSGSLTAGQYIVLANNLIPVAPGNYPYQLSMACSIPSALTEVVAEDFTVSAAADGWFGGVLLGTASFFESDGLCMSVPGPGDNMVGWVSPEGYIELADRTAYRIRVRVTTDQTAPDSIPLWEVIYNNFYPSTGAGMTYGGAAWFLDVDGGGQGIGRAQGSEVFDVWAVPPAALTDQWRGIVNPANGAFSPQADATNDMSVVIRINDPASAPLNAVIDSGTICVRSIEVTSISLDRTRALSTAFDRPLLSSNYAPQNFAQAAEAKGLAVINDTIGAAVYELDGPENRKSLFPYDGTLQAASLYPIEWEPQALYLGRVKIRSNETGAEGTDPVDAIFINFDSMNSELGQIGFASRGGPGNMHMASSPRLPSTTGGVAQTYVGLFSGQNGSASANPDAHRFRLSLDLFNTAVIAPQGQGSDSLAVESIEVIRIVVPE